MPHYDLLVIGGGSGGVASARASAAYGAKVGIVEASAMGGTCVNMGCMPKKYYMYGAMFAEEFKIAERYGWDVPKPSFQWARLRENTFKEITRLNGIYDRMLENANVTVHKGFARFKDAHTVQVAGDVITADKIMIAVGGVPQKLQISGAEHCITSDEAFHLEALPKSIMILGGGFIAVEFAGIFNALGVNVQVMIRKPHILTGFDEDVRTHLQEELSKKGIVFLTEDSPESIEKQADGSLVLHSKKGESYKADQVMMATGRAPRTADLGLAQAGVATNAKGEIEVDIWQQTSVPHIYAVGDVTNRHENLTPVAINEGRAFADTHFGKEKRNFSDFIVPSAVFSQPQVGIVGLTEAQARAEHGAVDIYRARFRPSKLALTDSEEKTLMKLVVDGKTDKVLGAHMVGPDAAEIIQTVGVALRAGATKKEFDRTVGVHPSLAEEFVTMRTKVEG